MKTRSTESLPEREVDAIGAKSANVNDKRSEDLSIGQANVLTGANVADDAEIATPVVALANPLSLQDYDKSWLWKFRINYSTRICAPKCRVTVERGIFLISPLPPFFSYVWRLGTLNWYLM